MKHGHPIQALAATETKPTQAVEKLGRLKFQAADDQKYG
jgi:hypothetical protein